jgi:hypothetical protein
MTVETGSAYPTKISYWDSESNVVKEKDSPVYAGVPNGEAIAISTKYEFIMLPLNEEYLEINADTREIHIPASFKKLVGVEGDHFAETLIFSIDRFFDYIDLLNDMQIYIEWKDKDDIDRYTPVSMIHYNASSGKILFGWPLSKEVTENAGTVQFAVRFFKQSEVEDSDGNKIILYSFSTKPHTLTIAKAIRRGLNTAATIDSAANTFLNAIKDSPSSSAPEAPIPVFSNPGEDLTSELDITNAEYTLTVQAVAEGTGHITYSNWWYQDENGNPA